MMILSILWISRADSLNVRTSVSEIVRAFFGRVATAIALGKRGTGRAARGSKTEFLERMSTGGTAICNSAGRRGSCLHTCWLPYLPKLPSTMCGLDGTREGTDGFEASPALRMTLPLFNRNRGKIAVAEAQLQQAMRRYVTVRDQIVLDVRTSYTSARQANGNLKTVKNEILPALETAVRLAGKNYLDGGTSYFLVLQTTSQFLDARAREIRLSADLRRAVAELERSVGHRFITKARLDEQPR